MYDKTVYKVASLFCGAGGLDMGFEMTGRFKTIWANDINKDATETMKLWCKNARIICGDVSKISNLAIPKADIFLGGFPCFVAGTLVNTGRGMIPIEEVEKGDMVLTLKNRYRKVLTTMYDIKEGIHKLKIQGCHELMCTDNHPFLVRSIKTKVRYKTINGVRKYDSIKVYGNMTKTYAKDIKEGEYVGTPINSESTNIKCLTLEECWLLGRYVADGYIQNSKRSDRENSYNNNVIFCVGTHKLGEFEDEVTDYHYTPSDNGKVIKCIINNKRLMELCKECGRGAENKKIPKFILDLPEIYLEKFLAGVMSGDGCFTEGMWQLTSVSKILIYQIAQVVAKLYKVGYQIKRIRKNPTCVIEGRVVNQKDNWVIRFAKERPKQAQWHYADGLLWFKVKSNEFDPTYKLPTYNIEVEEDHTYTVNNIGTFNCQGFSIAGKMDINDPRNKLYKEYVRVLKRVQPYCFIGENVQGLLLMENGAIIDQIAKDFSNAGYNIHYDLVDAVDYGVAQNRKRLIIVGYRKDIEGLVFPKPEKCEHKTMYDVIYDMPEPREDEVHSGGFSPRYLTRNRLRGWREPSFTIVAGGRNTPLHPSSCPMVKIGNESWGLGSGGKSRRLSYKECALLQSFPKDMKFIGSLESKYKQIGNAVPPLLGYAYAKEIAKELDKLNLKSSTSNIVMDDGF